MAPDAAPEEVTDGSAVVLMDKRLATACTHQEQLPPLPRRATLVVKAEGGQRPVQSVLLGQEHQARLLNVLAEHTTGRIIRLPIA
jgi:hypothetical protein